MVTLQVMTRTDAEEERRQLEAAIGAALATTDRQILRRLSMKSGTPQDIIRSIERLAELDFLLAT